MPEKYNVTDWDQFGSEYDFPEFRGQPRVFVVATTPRCGSHYLCHHLRKTGLLGCPLEYFSEARFRDWCRKLKTSDPNKVIEYLYAHRSSPNGIFGVKAHWPQFEWFQRVKVKIDKRAKTPFLHIIRQDRVAQAVSWSVAQQTNSWISFHKIRGQPVYDYGQVFAAYQSIEYEAKQWTRYLQDERNPVLELVYEEFEKDVSGAVVSIADFLNVDLSQNHYDVFTRLPQRQMFHLKARWCELFRSDLKRLNG